MRIVLDKLDRQLLERISDIDCVLLADIKDEFQQEPYHKLYYRIRTLADNNYIRLYRGATL
jgi:ribosomal protein S3AE